MFFIIILLKLWNINNIFLNFFLDVLQKLGFDKDCIKENSIEEDEEIPEV